MSKQIRTETSKTDIQQANIIQTEKIQAQTVNPEQEWAKTNQADAEQSEAGQAGAKQTDAEQPEAGQAGAKQTDAEQSEAGQAGAKQTDAEQAETGRAGAKQSDEEQAETGQAEAKQAESQQKEDLSSKEIGEDEKETTDVKKEKLSGLEEVPLDPPAKKKTPSKRSWKKIVIIVILLLLLLILLGAGAVYSWKADYYKTHFLPNVTINRMDCGGLDCETVISMIQEQSREYSLAVYGQDNEQLGVLSAEEIGLAIDIEKDVENLLAMQEPWKWILAYRTNVSYDIVYEVEYNAAMLKERLLQWQAFQKDKMEPPQDAYITDYLPEEKAYQIVAETRGSLIDIERVCDVLGAAIQTGEASANLEDAGCYIRAKITSEDAELQKRVQSLNKLVGTKITYDWNGEEFILDGDIIHEWIIEEKGKYSIDEEKVADFVALHAKENDTYGKKRSFVTTLGEKLSLPSGAYGWKTDREQETEELMQLILEGKVTEREPVYRNTAAHKGKDDIGSSYVEIDLSNQHLYLYIDGSVVLETDFVSGNVSRGNTTPPGVFGLTYKTRNAVLRGATYETPVSYWMPFNGNIGMHDATWRASFGGDIYLTDGSHGCINLPLGKAEEIYGYVSKGFPVVCYYY